MATFIPGIKIISRGPAYTIARPGTTVRCKLWVSEKKPIHWTRGYFGINYDGAVCKSKYNVLFYSLHRTDKIECSFKMPDKVTKITYYGGHEEDGKWVEDFSVVHTITPEKVEKPPEIVGKPKACVSFISPGGDFSTGVGKPVSAKFRIKNCGTAKGNFYYLIQKDGVTCKSKYNDWIDVGRTGSKLTCSFTMPEKDVKLLFLAGHAEEGKWVEDYRFEIKASPLVPKPPVPPVPPAPPKTCKQLLKLIDEKLLPIGGVPVSIVGVGTKYTDAGGKISFTLEKGKKYTIKAVKAGLIPLETTFTATCVGTIPLTWKVAVPAVPEPGKCEQLFRVVDNIGKPIEGAKVVYEDPVYGPRWAITGSDGRASLTFTGGKSYTVNAQKVPDYKCYNTLCKMTFIACTKEIPLILIPKKCSQPFRVVDRKGVPIEGATVSSIKYYVHRETTGKDGRCILSGLSAGESYKAIAYAKGYKGYDKKYEKTFTACMEEIVLSLEKVIVECTQWVKVVDEKGVPIGGVPVIFKGVGKKFTGSDGRTSVSLEKDKSYTAIAEKADYGCVDCEKTFTACTKDIVLTLKKTIVLPAKCTQWVKVVDEKGIPIKGAYVGFFIDGLFKRPQTGTDGRCSMDLEEGKSYRLKVELAGFEPGELKSTACTKEIVVTLKKKKIVPPPPKKCTQKVKVVDDKKAPIGGASVRMIGIGKKSTNSTGKISFTLEEGKEYTVKTEKTGYECVDCEKTFTACIEEIVLTLKKKIVKPPEIKCKQLVKIFDEKGKPVGGATITFVGVGKKFSDTYGKTVISLITGKKYTVKTEKTGYECVDCEKTFTACVGVVELMLKKKEVVIPTELRGIQSFRVVDETGKPVDGAVVILFTDKAVVRAVRVKKDGLWSRRLIKGKEYTVKAEKEGYKCVDCKKTFTGFTKEEIHLILSKK